MIMGIFGGIQFVHYPNVSYHKQECLMYMYLRCYCIVAEFCFLNYERCVRCSARWLTFYQSSIICVSIIIL